MEPFLKRIDCQYAKPHDFADKEYNVKLKYFLMYYQGMKRQDFSIEKAIKINK